MNRPLKLVVISHSLVKTVNHNRWKMLAKDPNYEVHLIMPAYWEQTWFREKVIFEQAPSRDGSFFVHPLPTTSTWNWGRYLYKSLDLKFREIDPDLIYIMHEERVLVHHQIYLCRKLFAPLAKVIFFSMNARGVPGSTEKNPLKRIVKKGMWEGVKRNTDAALVHYPGCLKSLRTGGYKKPIFQQTQIGVDETLFAPSEETRKEVRNELGFNDDFVIGYAGRLVEDKGVDDILEVFLRIAESYENVSLLLVGNGGLREHIQERAREQRVKERIVVTGYVELKRVPRYMNAMDTLVLASKTTPHWIDTFPLVTVQAQAIGVPVVASDSGAIPWQLDATALLFKEGNREELYGALQSMIDDPDLRAEYAKKGRRRSLSYFCHQGMTENFKKIARQIMQEQIEYHASGEEYIQWKAY